MKKQDFNSNRRLFMPLLAILVIGAIGSYIAIISFGHAQIPASPGLALTSAHDEPFGMAGLQSPGSPSQTQQLNDYSTLGVQWARTGINWGQIQPTAGGAYNWTKFDTEFQQLAALHIKPLGVIHDIPSWAMASGCTAGSQCHPANPAQYAAFAGAVAAHFAPLGGHAWEIMNEVNSPKVWGTPPSPSDYTADLKAAYTAIKAADSSATVVTAGSAIAVSPGSIKPTDFLTQMYAAGARGYFDAVGEHPYCTNPVAETCVDSPTSSDGWYQVVGPNNLHDVMVANGDGNKLVWITEFGLVTPTDAASENLQIQVMNTAYAKQKELSWLGPLFWYEYQDGQFSADRTRQDLFGLVTLDGSHKPAFATYESLAHATQSPPPTSGGSTPTNTTASNTAKKSSTTSPTGKSPAPNSTTNTSKNNQVPSETTPNIAHPSRAVRYLLIEQTVVLAASLVGLFIWRLGLFYQLKRLLNSRR